MNELPPIPQEFTPVIASRGYEVVKGEHAMELLVEIGTPVQDVETVAGFDWRCPVRYTEGTEVRERQVCGVDGLQALQLALKLVELEVQALAGRADTRVMLAAW